MAAVDSDASLLAVTQIIKEFLDSEEPPPCQRPSLKGQVYSKLSIQNDDSRALLEALAEADGLILKKLVNNGEMPYWAVRYLESLHQSPLLDCDTYFENNEAIIRALTENSGLATNPHLLSLPDLIQTLKISRRTCITTESHYFNDGQLIPPSLVDQMGKAESTSTLPVSFNDQHSLVDGSFLTFVPRHQNLDWFRIPPPDEALKPAVRSIPISHESLYGILDLLEGMDWSNVLVVGRKLSNSLLCLPPAPLHTSIMPSFWDMCFYGLDDRGATEKLRYIEEYLSGHMGLGGSDSDGVVPIRVWRDLDVFVFETSTVCLRISLHLHKSISSALLTQKFDFDAIGFDGLGLLMLPRFVHAVETGLSIFRIDCLVGHHVLSPYSVPTSNAWSSSSGDLYHRITKISKHFKRFACRLALGAYYGQGLHVPIKDTPQIRTFERIRQMRERVKYPDERDDDGSWLLSTKFPMPPLKGDIVYLEHSRSYTNFIGQMLLGDEISVATFGVQSSYEYQAIDNRIFQMVLARLVSERAAESDPSVQWNRADYAGYLTRRIRVGYGGETVDECLSKQLAIPILIPEQLESLLISLTQDLPEHLQLDRMLIPLYNRSYEGIIPELQESHGSEGNARYWITSRRTMWIGQDPVVDKVRAVLSDLFEGFQALGNDRDAHFSCDDPTFLEGVRIYIEHRMQLRRKIRVFDQGSHGMRDATSRDIRNRALNGWIEAVEEDMEMQMEASDEPSSDEPSPA